MPPIVIAGAIAGGLSLFGAKKASDSARNAARTQERSATRALDLSSRMYDTTRSDLQPYMQAGTNALPGLSSLLSRPRPTFGAPGVPPVSGPMAGGLSGLQSGQSAQRGVIQVRAPNGKTYTFQTPQQADQFRQQAGL